MGPPAGRAGGAREPGAPALELTFLLDGCPARDLGTHDMNLSRTEPARCSGNRGLTAPCC